MVIFSTSVVRHGWFFFYIKMVGIIPHHIVVFNSGYKLIVIVSTFLTKK